MASSSSGPPLDPKSHIDRIRHDYGFGDEGEVLNSRALSNLDSAVGLIAQQLNSEVHHFLHELVQNADDLDYEGRQPLLTFEFLETHLLVTSNEKGFAYRDVEAICSIGQSTKINNANTTGEKGIGFKSLFKAAKSVTISSKGYKFGFDRDRHCGIVVPEWRDIPQEFSRADHEDKTVLLLEFISSEKAQIVKEELDNINTTMLMFLRQLCNVNVIVSGVCCCLSRVDGPRLNQPTGEAAGDSTVDHAIATPVIRYLEMSEGSTSPQRSEWVLLKHEFPLTEEYPKRAKRSSAKVTVALPKSTTLTEGTAYNVLPICQTRFPFLFDADFILSASREGLDQDHESYNSMLMRGVAAAYIRTITECNKGNLRYVWPRWLPDLSEMSRFAVIRTKIKSVLEAAAILFDDTEIARLSSSLIHIPLQWRDANGMPLFRVRKTRANGVNVDNLSTAYSEELLDKLKWLGVKTMESSRHVARFRLFANEDRGSHLRTKPVQWHSRLASALVQFTNGQNLQDLNLIPLQDGRWVKASGNTVFFPLKVAGMQTSAVLEGLSDVNVIKSEYAIVDQHALCNLYSMLGVKSGTPRQVSDAIIKAHSKDRPPTESVDILVAHAIHLFRARKDASAAKTPVWISNLDGFIFKSDTIYQDQSIVPSDIQQSCQGSTSERSFMHPAYLKAVPEAEHGEWSKWLSEKLGTFRGIRIANIEGDKFTPEFQRRIVTQQANPLLGLMSRSWRENFGTGSPPQGICNLLGKLAKDWTSSGTSRRSVCLQDMFLPHQRLRDAIPPGLPLIYVHDPDDEEKWHFLKYTGVSMVVDLNFWFSCLRNYAKGNAAASVPTVALAYQEILQYTVDPAKVREVFQQNKTIFIPRTPNGVWVYPAECLWRAKIQLRSKKVLSLIYSRDLEYFFNQILRIPHMNIDHVIDEFLNYQNDAGYLKELVMALSGTFNGSAQHKAKLQKLHNRPILPINRFVGGAEDKKVVAVNSKLEAWYLVDLSQHREAFLGKIWMADFSTHDVLKLSELMTSFGQIFSCSRPLLSDLVQERSEHEGKNGECSELATRLRSRSGYLACIMKHNNRRGEESKVKLKKLRDLRMHATPSILTRMTITEPPAIQGRPVRKKRVLFEDRAGSLQIYLRKDVARKQDFHQDVSKEIAGFLGITKPELIAIVQAVINADDEEEIREIFERERIFLDPEAHRVHAQLSTNGVSVETTDAVGPAVNGNGNGVASRTLQLTEDRSTPVSDSSEDSDTAAPLSNATNRTLPTRSDRPGRIARQGVATADVVSRGSEEVQPQQGPLRQPTERTVVEAPQDGTSLDQYIRPNRAVNGRGTHQRRDDDEYPGQAPSAGTGDTAIGQQGELLVYHRLKSVLGDQFIAIQYWTSEFRHLLIPDIPAWRSNDSRSFYADFTIVNAPATLLEYLDAEARGTRLTDIGAESVNVYIEVKSTRGAATESLRLSDWQWAEAKRMDQALAIVDATGEVDVFVVMRVSGVGSGSNEEIKVIKDVWKRYAEGEAKLRTFGGVEVSGL